MNNEKNNNSNLPLAIIAVVLVAALIGGWYFYSNAKTSSNKKANTNSNTSPGKTPKDEVAMLEAYNKAYPGAQPPNMLGSPTATVTVEEFADYQCPTCATVHGKMKEINKIYSGRIKFIYRSFPLTQIHKNAYDAALAAEAAGIQGKYWAMQDQLFSNQQAWSTSNDARKIFGEYAEKIGLDVAKFQTDLIALPTKTRVDNDLQRGRALNIQGTPSIYINGKEIPVEQMEVNTLRQIIDGELQKGGNSSSQTQPNQQPAAQTNSATNETSNSGGASNSK
jgi:protein-disulfide isomerase